jgi:hypothetical protein
MGTPKLMSANQVRRIADKDSNGGQHADAASGPSVREEGLREPA